MSDIALCAEGLGKRYRIGTHQPYMTLRESLKDTVSAPFRQLRSLFHAPSGDAEAGSFWALKSVSFEVTRGTVIGVIGRNGAGKSTLLKILSRITKPTEGRVRVCGRVSSLLEVGTGFHYELTGRENIFLNGAILGMKRAEIVRKFDEIVNFAELEKFIDTPVKHFSSGMYMRLAFAVAAHLEPEILLVDEVLAVGDAQFQKKCLGKIGEVATEGRTVLFVSHNMGAITRLCGRAVCLDGGQLVDEGNVRDVVAKYLRDVPRPPTSRTWPEPAGAPGNESVRLQEVCVLAGDSHSRHLTLDMPIDISVSYWNRSSANQLSVKVVLYNSDDVCVLSAVSPAAIKPVGLVRETCRIPGCLLNVGDYHFHVLLIRDVVTTLLDVPDAGSFEVFEAYRSLGWHSEWLGVVRPRLTWLSECELDPHGAPDEQRQMLAS
jgi:lipopolysaccharide transport system ATP-binding protein